MSVAFIPRENMTSVYERDSLPLLTDMAYCHFMNYRDEVLYILDNGSMYGILSIGDLERFYSEDQRKIEVNRKYTAINQIDYEEAARFFERVKTVNEIPVILGNNELLGVVKKEKEEELRINQRKSLKLAKKYAWQRSEIKRFISRTKASVFLYYVDTKCLRLLRKEDMKILTNRGKSGDIPGWCGLTDEEWEKFWGPEYRNGIVETMRAEIKRMRLLYQGGINNFFDMEGECYNFKDGYRITPNPPPDADRKIYMYGPCIVMGAFCKDNQTIEAYLQNSLNENSYQEWKVLNKGLCGPDYCYDQMFVEELSGNDIVIIWSLEEFWKPGKVQMNKSVFEKNLTDVFLSIPRIADYVANGILHCNYIVNQRLAERLYHDIDSTGMLERPKRKEMPERIQDYYINWDICEYFTEYFERYGLLKEPENIKIGAIVMNCNPFTKGHRYLIEKALSMTDKLYVFVVEEDASYFPFKDRMKMVEMGVSDLQDVRVIPSGRYILSKDTFAQYFEKEQIQEVESMDFDIYIFGKVVAARLGIQYRFVGEEPFDQVTKEYNEAMKRVLPQFGVEVIEIPRAAVGEQAISASLVRKAVHKKNLSMVKELCPKSTVAYLTENYLELQKENG